MSVLVFREDESNLGFVPTNSISLISGFAFEQI